MITKREPQHGHGGRSAPEASPEADVPAAVSGIATPSSSRARSMISARWPVASRPPAFAGAGYVADAVEAFGQPAVT